MIWLWYFILKDRYAEDYSVPVLDQHQDYELTGFSEKDGTTTLKFKRKLNTCDDQDREIKVTFYSGKGDFCFHFLS